MKTNRKTLLVPVVAVLIAFSIAPFAFAQGIAHTEEHTVSLGGEEITVHLRSPANNRTLNIHDNGTQGGFFDRLAPAARDGNDDAAHWLWYSLEMCSRAPKSNAELEARLAEGRKKWAEAGGVFTPGDAPQNLDQWEKDQADAMRRCEGVTNEMYATATDLLRQSVVERGSDYNRAYYAQAIAKSDPEGAREQYKILWKQGDVTGLRGLGARSLPHRIAAIVVMGLVYNAPAKTDEYLHKMQMETSPSTYEQAEKAAARILQNPRCCVISRDW